MNTPQNATKELTKLPVGYVCRNGWGGKETKGHVELHIEAGNKTAQVTVDQEKQTIHINGFWKNIRYDASNAITLEF